MTGEVDAMLTPDGPCPFWADLHTENLTDGTASYDFSLDGTCAEAEHATCEERVVFPDLDGILRAFVIKQVEDSPPVRAVHSEPLHVDELGSIRLAPASWTAQPVATIAAAILAGSGWVLGKADWAGTPSMKVTHEDTPLSALQTLAKTHDPALEMDFRVTFDGSRITGRYVDLYLQRGSVTNLVFEYGADLRSSKRTAKSPELYTAMKGLGKADASGTPLTLATAGAAADHEASSLIVTDKDALQAYGRVDSDGNRIHRVGIFNDPDETNAANLLVKTRAALKKQLQPEETYEADIVMLERLGFDWRKVRLGDTIVVRDLRMNPPIDHTDRITETRVSYADPTGGTS
jgi:phage minor structural protein